MAGTLSYNSPTTMKPAATTKTVTTTADAGGISGDGISGVGFGGGGIDGVGISSGGGGGGANDDTTGDDVKAGSCELGDDNTNKGDGGSIYDGTNCYGYIHGGASMMLLQMTAVVRDTQTILNCTSVWWQ